MDAYHYSKTANDLSADRHEKLGAGNVDQRKKEGYEYFLHEEHGSAYDRNGVMES